MNYQKFWYQMVEQNKGQHMLKILKENFYFKILAIWQYTLQDTTHLDTHGNFIFAFALLHHLTFYKTHINLHKYPSQTLLL